MKEIIVLGIGHTTPVFVELALDAGFTITSLYHYNGELSHKTLYGFNVEGSFDDLFNTDIQGKYFLLTMGDMRIRRELTERILANGGLVPTIIHPSALVSRFAQISTNGVLIAPNCIVQADVEIGDGVVMRDSALVCHTTKIENYTFIGPKALVGAKMHLNEDVFVGQSALLVSGKVNEVGAQSVIGAGSVVTKPVKEYDTVVGNPAKVLKSRQIGGGGKLRRFMCSGQQVINIKMAC